MVNSRRARVGGLLVLAFVTLILSNGRWIVAPAAWIAPILLLRFIEKRRPVVGLPLGFLAFTVASAVAWRGLIPAPGALYYAIIGTYGVVYFLPFATHRLVTPVFHGFGRTLVFPSAWVALEYVFQAFVTPYGSWFSLAYTQQPGSLLQIASLTGTAGVSFLITWFAAVVVWVWSAGFERRSLRVAGAVYGGTLAAVLLFGTVRLAEGTTSERTVRTASIMPNRALTTALERAMRGAWTVTEGASFDSITQIATRLNDDLFTRTHREAAAGAMLIAWSETAGRTLKTDEETFLARGQDIAREMGVHLLLAYGTWTPGGTPPLENKVVAIHPGGTIAWHYHKARPIVGPESPFIDAGAGDLLFLDTPHGRVGAVICHDLDFPDFIRQAGRGSVDILVAPSADWDDIASMHARMAVLRAVENGFTLLRPTSTGLSIATDATGRVLAAQPDGPTEMIATIPGAGRATWYARVGDVFAQLCVVVVTVVVIVAVKRS
jgi:apolipoprotein N-acyltransferase